MIYFQAGKTYEFINDATNLPSIQSVVSPANYVIIDEYVEGGGNGNNVTLQLLPNIVTSLQYSSKVPNIVFSHTVNQGNRTDDLVFLYSNDPSANDPIWQRSNVFGAEYNVQSNNLWSLFTSNDYNNQNALDVWSEDALYNKIYFYDDGVDVTHQENIEHQTRALENYKGDNDVGLTYRINLWHFLRISTTFLQYDETFIIPVKRPSGYYAPSPVAYDLTFDTSQNVYIEFDLSADDVDVSYIISSVPQNGILYQNYNAILMNDDDSRTLTNKSLLF